MKCPCFSHAILLWDISQQCLHFDVISTWLPQHSYTPPPLVLPTKMAIFTSYSTYNKTISYTQDMSYERSKFYLSNNWSVQERTRQHCPEKKSVNADMHKEQTSWENTKMVATLRSLCYCPLKANTGLAALQYCKKSQFSRCLKTYLDLSIRLQLLIIFIIY